PYGSDQLRPAQVPPRGARRRAQPRRALQQARRADLRIAVARVEDRAQAGRFQRVKQLREPVAPALPRVEGIPGSAERTIRLSDTAETHATPAQSGPGPGRTLARLRADRKL